MPWCPKCIAEYRDSVVKCPTCEVALVDERPRPPEEPLAVARRSSLWLASEVHSQAGRSIRYGVGGLRLLRRHPALLVIPLLLMLLRAYDTTLGQYAIPRYLAQRERFAEAEQFSAPARIPAGQRLRSVLLNRRTAVAVSRLAGPLHYMTLQGTGTVLALSWTKDELVGEGQVPLPPAPALQIFLFLFGFAVSSFALGGFFGMVKQVGEEGSLTWRGFETNARRCWARFFLFQTIALVVFRWPYLFQAVPAYPHWRATLYHAWTMWVAPVAAFFMALTWYAILTEDAGIWTALVRSAQTVGRHVVTGVHLLLAVGLTRLALLVPLEVGDALLIARYSADYSDWPWVSLPTVLVGGVTGVIVDVWVCLTAFLWYRDARLRTATTSEVG